MLRPSFLSRPLATTVCAVMLCSWLLAAPPSYADVRGDSRAQVEFGIAAAQKELWKEALYRWQRAVEIDPTYAAAFNNLAIGFEHEGKFEDARKAYEKALDLEPNNQLIQQNYDLFKEINDRTKRGKAQ